jgi:hypothetical protein
MDKKLTIGMATHNDYDGVYFTIQSIRMNNRALDNLLDFVVVDNNPESNHGKTLRHFCEVSGVRYVPEGGWASTAVRNRVFEHALAPYVLCMDSHVLVLPDAISRLISFYNENPETDDIFHGPMLYDKLNPEGMLVTHMKPVWRDNMFGTWAAEPEKKMPYANEPFVIPMHGMGLFTCRTDAWQGFHPLFRGFGGEEGYIHEKFRNAGAVAQCLPWLKWLHRFDRPNPVSYPMPVEMRALNYFIGWKDVGLPLQDIHDHFNKLHPDMDTVALAKEANEWLDLYNDNPDSALVKRHDPTTLPRTWHKTETDIAQPIEVDVYGKKFLVSGLGIKWSTD